MIYDFPPQHYHCLVEERVLSSDFDRIKNSFTAFNKNFYIDGSSIQPLTKGMTQSTFLVTVQSLTYVIKLFDSTLPKSTLLKQFMHYQKALELGVGPYIWHFDLSYRALIMEYIESKEPNILEAISMLRTFHRPFENEPFATIYKRILKICTYECEEMQHIERASLRLKNIEKSIKPVYTLCHFDFHKDNFMSTDARTYLIDFDNADFGHPFYDIAKFTLREEAMTSEEILHAYLQREPTENERYQLSLMVQVARFSSATNRMLRFLKGGYSDKRLYQEAVEALHLFLENTNNFGDDHVEKTKAWQTGP